MLVVAAALIPADVLAGGSEILLRQTFGSENYVGTYAAVQFGEDRYLRPAYAQYESDVSGGTRRTVSLSAGRRSAAWLLNAQTGLSPKTAGYGRLYIYGTAKRVYERADWRFRLGGELGATDHLRETTSMVAAGRGRNSRPLTTETKDVLQTEAGITFGASGFGFAFNVDGTRSIYDSDIRPAVLFTEPTPHSAGIGWTSESYPRYRAGISVDLLRFDHVMPYLAGNYTVYETDTGDSRGFLAGASFSVRTWSFDLDYERFIPASTVLAANYVGLKIARTF